MALSFNEAGPKKSTDTVLVVDSLNLAFRWKHQGRTDFRYDFEKTVASLATSYGCGKVLITSDKGSSKYRKEISSEYKQNRKDKYKDQTDEEKMKFEEFFEEYEAALEVLEEAGYPVFRYDGVEADDIAAHLVRYMDEYGFKNIWLISTDRDWDLLIQDNVSRFSYTTRKEITLTNWFEHYNIKPEHYIDYKCLIGDSGDNIPGISGIGPKRARDLIEEYGGVMDIYDQVPLPSKYKFISELNNNADILLKNIELMDLMSYCDEAIGTENIEKIQRELGL